ncbi:MAG: hypothetical protein AAFP69_13380, partial [Planctomycetota bacterium]
LGPWRYIRYTDGGEELYDHRVDPHEFRNVADAAQQSKTIEQMRELIPEKWEPSLGGRNG